MSPKKSEWVKKTFLKLKIAHFKKYVDYKNENI
jgi:hypothetical protein